MPTWNYSATAAGPLKDLHDSSHRSMKTCSTSKNCTKDRRVVCAWGGSLLTTDVINPRGFCVETRSISLEVPFTRRSQMQLSSALQAVGAAVTTESSHKKQRPSQRKFEGQGTQRHLPSLLLYPLSSRFLLSLYGKIGKKSLDVPCNGQVDGGGKATSFLLAHLGRSHYVLFSFSGIKNSKIK